jgi:uncharacterized protein YodC (DUF2158 family)
MTGLRQRFVEDNMEELKVGDVVQLRSGGPKMTVANANQPGKAFCIWFASDNAVQYESAQFDCLVLRKLAEDAASG